MKIAIQDIFKNCPEAYWELVDSGKIDGAHFITEDAALFEKCSEPIKEFVSGIAQSLVQVKTAKPVEWPIWAKQILKNRSETDKGVGDTAERLFGAFGGDLFKSAFKKLFGADCGCAQRKESWNNQFPYD